MRYSLIAASSEQTTQIIFIVSNLERSHLAFELHPIRIGNCVFSVLCSISLYSQIAIIAAIATPYVFPVHTITNDAARDNIVQRLSLA
jgi:hypothetical protein